MKNKNESYEQREEKTSGMALYQINREMESLLDQLEDTETGEMAEADEELWQRLEQLGLAFNVKVENIVRYIKNLDALVEALRAEENRLRERRLRKDHLKEKLEDYLLFALDGKPFESEAAEISYRKTIATEIDDQEFFSHPENLERTDLYSEETYRHVWKNTVKQHLKAGEEIPGARLVESTKMIIK